MQFTREKSLGSWVRSNGFVQEGWRNCNDYSIDFV